MAGISQVWLTEDELAQIEAAMDHTAADVYGADMGQLPPPPFTAAQAKIKSALEPVACKV